MALSLCTTAFAASSYYYNFASATVTGAKQNGDTYEVCPGGSFSFVVKVSRGNSKSNSSAYATYTVKKDDTAMSGKKDQTISSSGSGTTIQITADEKVGTTYTLYTKDRTAGASDTPRATVTVVAHDIATVTDYKAPTCTVAGNEALYQCKNCKTYYKDLAGKNRVMLPGMPGAWKTTLPAQGGQGGGKINATHTLATVTDYKAPTCLEAGNKALYKCSVCSKYFDNKNNEVEASQVASWTSVAGKLDKTDHNWNDWTADQDTRTLSRSCTTAGCTAEESVILSLNPTTPSVGSKLSAYIVTTPTDVQVKYEVRRTGFGNPQWYSTDWQSKPITADTTSKDNTYYRASITKGDATVYVVFPKCGHKMADLTSLEVTGDYNTSMQSTVKATCSCGWTSTAKLDWNAAKNGVIFVNGDPNDTWTAEDVAFWDQFTIYYAEKMTEGQDHKYTFDNVTAEYSPAKRFAFMAEKACDNAGFAKWNSIDDKVCNHHQPILKLDPYFAVTFDEKGGTPIVGATIEKSYYYGEKIATPNPNPTKGTLLFDGWYNGTTKWNFSTTVTTNTNLIAKYYAKVTFDKNGAAGTTPKDLTVYEGSKVTQPNNTTLGLAKIGYDFEVWFYKTSGDKYAKWDFNTAIASNTELDENGVLTLYAGWTQVKHEATTTDFTPAVVGDVAANFTVPGGSYELLLIDAEKQAIKNEGNSYELILNVETPNASATDVAKELAQLGVKRDKNEKLAFQADISLTKIAKDVMGDKIGSPTDITKTDKTIRVTIDVPDEVCEELKAVPHGYSRTIYVNRAHTEDGTVNVERMGNVLFDSRNGTLSFDTNQFSVYEITYVDTKISHPHAHYVVNSVKTGDSGVLLYGVLAVSSLMGMGYFRSRREDEM